MKMVTKYNLFILEVLKAWMDPDRTSDEIHLAFYVAGSHAIDSSWMPRFCFPNTATGRLLFFTFSLFIFTSRFGTAPKEAIYFPFFHSRQQFFSKSQPLLFR